MKTQQKRRGVVRIFFFFLSDEAMVGYTVNSYQICLCQKIWRDLGFVFTETVSFKMFIAVHVLSHCVSFKTIKIAKKLRLESTASQIIQGSH